MKKFFLKTVFIDLLIIFFVSLTPLLWFKDSNTLMIGHDNVFPLDPITFLSGRLYTWIEHGFGQSQALIMGTIPVHLIDALPAFFGASVYTTQRIVFVTWFFLIGVSAYVLAYVLNKESRAFRFIAVFFYQFNFFILQAWWIFERTKFSAYIALPLILSVYFKTYFGEISIRRAVLLNILILFLFNAGGLYGISLYGGFLVALFVFFILFSLLCLWRKKYDVIKRFFLVSIFTLLGTFIIDAYYIFPAASNFFVHYSAGLGKGGGVLGFINWAYEISANASYINIFRLQGISEWYDNVHHPYAKYYLHNILLITISFIWPILIFLSVLTVKTKRRTELVLFFLFTYLVGVFFVAGTHSPLGFIYVLFIKFIPGAIAFRSPYFKFAPSIFLATSFLIAMLFTETSGKVKKILFVLLLVLLFGYHFPYFTGNFFSWKQGFSTRVEVPNYVFEFGEWIRTKKLTDGRIVMLPPNDPASQYSAYKWGYLSFQPLPTLLSNNQILINNDRIDDREQALMLHFYKSLKDGDIPLVEKLAKDMHIKYFLLQKDAITDANSFHSFDPNSYKKILSNTDVFSLIQMFGEWEVYEIKTPINSKMYLAKDLAVVQTPLDKLDSYYYFAKDNTHFVLAEDYPVQTKVDISPLINGRYQVPRCLNCRFEIEPEIEILDRQILPDSFLYPFVLFNEQSKFEEAAVPSQQLYNYLGLSLKRLSELGKTISQKRKVTQPEVERYSTLLHSIDNEFKKLTDYREQFELAEETHYYLKAERKYLNRILGTQVNGGKDADAIERISAIIAKVEKTIDPFLFKMDSSNNRLYLINSEAGTFDTHIKLKDIASAVNTESRITVTVDNTQINEIVLDENSLKNDWISVGKITLSKGQHLVLISLPEIENKISGFSKEEHPLYAKVDEVCYTTAVTKYDNTKIYNLTFDFDNNFTNNLNLYVVKHMGEKLFVDKIFTFKSNVEHEVFKSLIYSASDVTGLSIGICSNNFNSSFLEQKVQLSVKEVVHPMLVTFEERPPKKDTMPISFTMIDPTEYVVNVNSSDPSILVFKERYDEGWQLEGFEEKHFQIDGYANAWKIDKPLKQSLKLTYKPQKFFYLGAGITAVTLVGILIVLIKDRKKG